MIEWGINRNEVLPKMEAFLLKLLELRAEDSAKPVCEYCLQAFREIPGLHLTKKVPGPGTGEFSMEFTWSGLGRAKAVYFHAWMDDLPQPAEGPVAPAAVEGYIHGTGAAAGKSGVAALYGLMLELSRTYTRYPFDVKIHLTVGQRQGGAGSAALAAETDGQAMLLLEPTGGNLVTRHVGCLWMKLVTTGVACHTSQVLPGKGGNAMVSMFSLLDELEALHGEYAAAVREESDLRTFFNIGSFHSGVWIGALAPRAEALVAVTLVPSPRTEAFVAACMELAKEKEATVEILQSRECGGGKELPEVFRDLPDCLHKVRCAGYAAGSEYPMDLGIYEKIAGIPVAAFGTSDPAVVATVREKIAEKDLLDTVQAMSFWLEKLSGK